MRIWLCADWGPAPAFWFKQWQIKWMMLFVFVTSPPMRRQEKNQPNQFVHESFNSQLVIKLKAQFKRTKWELTVLLAESCLTSEALSFYAKVRYKSPLMGGKWSLSVVCVCILTSRAVTFSVEQVVILNARPSSGSLWFSFYFRVNVTWLTLPCHLCARITCYGCHTKLQLCREKKEHEQHRGDGGK